MSSICARCSQNLLKFRFYTLISKEGQATKGKYDLGLAAPLRFHATSASLFRQYRPGVKPIQKTTTDQDPVLHGKHETFGGNGHPRPHEQDVQEGQLFADMMRRKVGQAADNMPADPGFAGTYIVTNEGMPLRKAQRAWPPRTEEDATIDDSGWEPQSRMVSQAQMQRKITHGHPSKERKESWKEGTGSETRRTGTEKGYAGVKSSGKSLGSGKTYCGGRLEQQGVMDSVSADLMEMAPDKTGRQNQNQCSEQNHHRNQKHYQQDARKWVAPKPYNIPDGNDLLFGISPCLLALQQARREVTQVFVTPAFQRSHRSEVKAILGLIKEKRLRMVTTSRRVLDQLSGKRVHQGVCMDASRLYFDPILETTESEDSKASKASKASVKLVLDQIRDPMNLGALLRSAYFLGIEDVIVSKKNCCPLTPVVSKASSGVVEVLQVYASQDIPSFLETEKRTGWGIVGAAIDQADSSRDVIPCHTYSRTQPVILVVGSEGFGLSQDIQNLCSEFISVPAGRQLHPGIDSLNVSVATGILLHSLLGRM